MKSVSKSNKNSSLMIEAQKNNQKCFLEEAVNIINIRTILEDSFDAWLKLFNIDIHTIRTLGNTIKVGRTSMIESKISLEQAERKTRILNLSNR